MTRQQAVDQVKQFLKPYRVAYNAACAYIGFILSGPWAWVLASVRDEESLAGAWVMAMIPFGLLVLWDNAARVAVACAHPDLLMPKFRAAVARTLLWAAFIATCTTLPILTASTFLTGVRP